MMNEPTAGNQMTFRQDAHSLSHVGCVRHLNEDRSFAAPAIGIWAVADGMGGHHAGDFASETIVRNLQKVESATTPADLEVAFCGAVQNANTEIFHYAQRQGNIVVGSTFVGLLCFGFLFRCYWCGDSRAYLLRNDSLTQISHDHTEVQELLDQGLLTVEEAASYPRRNAITQAVGVTEQLYMDHVDGEIRAGDAFLLCTDGLTNHLSDLEIGRLMTGRRASDICHDLVDLALSRGGTDNVTVNIVQFFSASATIPVSGPIARPQTFGGAG
jgi:serine/threonine protein phosphatase PrpC